MPGSGRSKAAVFAILVAIVVALGAGYVAWAATRGGDAALPGTGSGPSSATADPTQIVQARAEAHVVFQNVVRGPDYAKVAVAPLDALAAGRVTTDLVCERVHFAAGQGLCLVPRQGLTTTFVAITFGEDYQPRGQIDLAGSPSRARVSPDGRYGAATVFVFGHSYADANFSTQTTIIDMASGTSIAELEQFTVLRDGTAMSAPDFNFWGVTFTQDSDRFFATLRTAGRTYLVDGSISARELRVVAQGVECPSVSPDGSRLAFKSLVGEGPTWRLTTMDLSTGARTGLAESRSVDDQVEWLDDSNILYGLGADVWTVPADGSGTAAIFMAEALSPAVVR
ncbi:PD40 domain-containing protein [soil metagenome]